MKKILLFTFLSFFTFAANAQLALNSSESPTVRVNKKTIKVFPNPATEYIMLNDNNGDVAEINMYNIVGKKLATFKEVQEGKKYYVSNLPKGMYLVQLVDDKNKILSTQRLSIRRP